MTLQYAEKSPFRCFAVIFKTPNPLTIMVLVYFANSWRLMNLCNYQSSLKLLPLSIDNGSHKENVGKLLHSIGIKPS